MQQCKISWKVPVKSLKIKKKKLNYYRANVKFACYKFFFVNIGQTNFILAKRRNTTHHYALFSEHNGFPWYILNFRHLDDGSRIIDRSRKLYTINLIVLQRVLEYYAVIFKIRVLSSKFLLFIINKFLKFL